MNLTEIEQNKVKKYAEIMAIATVEYTYRDSGVKWTELSENSQFCHIQNCMSAAEAVVKHLQSLLTEDEDVANAIETMYQNVPSMPEFDKIQDLRRKAARYGASLAGKKKAVAFGEWINNGRFDFTGEQEWINLDTKEIFTTDQLYEIFETDYLKNTSKHEK